MTFGTHLMTLGSPTSNLANLNMSFASAHLLHVPISDCIDFSIFGRILANVKLPLNSYFHPDSTSSGHLRYISRTEIKNFREICLKTTIVETTFSVEINFQNTFSEYFFRM